MPGYWSAPIRAIARRRSETDVTTPMLIPLQNPEGWLAQGVPFKSEHAARWSFRRRHEMGLAKAFVRLGRRIYVDPAGFAEAIHDLKNNARAR